MKPFDLTLAKAGQPIVRQYITDNLAIPVLFIGVCMSGKIAVEPTDGGAIMQYDPADLRMAPVVRTYYLGMEIGGGSTDGPWFSSEDDALHWTNQFIHRKYIKVEVSE